MRLSPAIVLFAAFLLCLGPTARAADDDLKKGDKVPNKAEKEASGAATAKIKKGTEEFKALTNNKNADIDFKQDNCHYMSKSLSDKVDALAKLVKEEWPTLKLRITAAWDEDGHGANSTHYEARGADLTTSDTDGKKLGRLARLAVKAGFDWVFYEDEAHVHVSVKK